MPEVDKIAVAAPGPFQPPTAHDQVVHVPIEHGHADRRLFHKPPEPLFAGTERLLQFLPSQVRDNQTEKLPAVEEQATG